jgi:hypothetical protein
MLFRKLLAMPLVENMEKAMENTSTQLMKFGSVVTVWTILRYRILLTSLRKMANTMGSQENAMPSPLMANVFTRTCHRILILAALPKRYSNQCNPTQGDFEKGIGGL